MRTIKEIGEIEEKNHLKTGENLLNYCQSKADNIKEKQEPMNLLPALSVERD